MRRDVTSTCRHGPTKCIKPRRLVNDSLREVMGCGS